MTAPQALQYVEANGLRFAYIAEGEGPLALLLHGFPDTPHTWDHFRPLIAAKGYRVVSPFMRGYRPSGIPSSDADGETLARDAIELIGALGAKEAALARRTAQRRWLPSECESSSPSGSRIRQH